MVETITPAVHGGSRTRWGAAVAVHTLAATAVAAAFGTVLGAAGRLLQAPWGGGGRLLVSVAAAWALAHESLGVPFPVPQLRRQVPDWWRTFFSPVASAALYGAGLGVGFLTYLLHATFVVVALAAFASGQPVAGALLVGAFGLARGASAVAAARGPGVVHSLAEFAARPARLRAIHSVALAAVVVVHVASAGTRVDAPGLALAGLAVVFACAAGWKTLRFRRWRGILDAYFLGRASPIVAAAVPSVEAGVALLALAGMRRPAAVLALASLAAFTGAAIRGRLRDPSLVPCGCFGASETSLGRLVARNVLLAGLAAAALPAPDTSRLAIPSPGDAAPVTLTLAGALGLVAVVSSVRRSLRRGRV